MSAAPRFLVCGTRAVVQRAPQDYRVVCATCGGGGHVRHADKESASRAAIRYSAHPCPARQPCGAK